MLAAAPSTLTRSCSCHAWAGTDSGGVSGGSQPGDGPGAGDECVQAVYPSRPCWRRWYLELAEATVRHGPGWDR
jgi:hypothetical protein